MNINDDKYNHDDDTDHNNSNINDDVSTVNRNKHK